MNNIICSGCGEKKEGESSTPCLHCGETKVTFVFNVNAGEAETSFGEPKTLFK